MALLTSGIFNLWQTKKISTEENQVMKTSFTLYFKVLLTMKSSML